MVNKVILIGNVGADPEVRYLEGGVAVANLRLATTERYKNKNGENIDQTEWHNIVLWRGLAEIVEKYVKKGMRLYIEGRIRTRSWDDQNGVKDIRPKFMPIICKCYLPDKTVRPQEMLPDLIRRRFQVALQRPLLLR